MNGELLTHVSPGLILENGSVLGGMNSQGSGTAQTGIATGEAGCKPLREFGSAPAFEPMTFASVGHAPESPVSDLHERTGFSAATGSCFDSGSVCSHAGRIGRQGFVPPEMPASGTPNNREASDGHAVTSFLETFHICRNCRHQFAPHLMRCPECNAPSPEDGE
jgi:hypothetical protein